MKKSLLSVHLGLGYVICTSTYDGIMDHGVADVFNSGDPLQMAVGIIAAGLSTGWDMSMEVFP